MLLRFGVENHKAIRDYQEISLVASRLKDRTDGLLSVDGAMVDHNNLPSLLILPAIAVYGPNASGKSTALNALQHISSVVRWSHSRGEADSGLNYTPFLLEKNEFPKPSRYDIDFVIDGTRYHFGFVHDEHEIHSEWLFSFPLKSARQTKTVLYSRDREQPEKFFFGKQLKGSNRQISNLVRKNSLFLSAAAQNSHPLLEKISGFFSHQCTFQTGRGEILSTSQVKNINALLSTDLQRQKLALQFLSKADTGIVGFDFEEVQVDEKTKSMTADLGQLLKKYVEVPEAFFDETEMTLSLKHAGASGEEFAIRIALESAGTIALLIILGPIFEKLFNGGVIVVDELNSTLHPLVTREIVSLFSSRESNPGGAQLIFTTHDTNILCSKLLRRDQVWMAEKDRAGASSFFSLAEMKVRSNENLEAAYLQGRFGAVPHFNLGA